MTEQTQMHLINIRFIVTTVTGNHSSSWGQSMLPQRLLPRRLFPPKVLLLYGTCTNIWCEEQEIQCFLKDCCTEIELFGQTLASTMECSTVSPKHEGTWPWTKYWWPLEALARNLWRTWPCRLHHEYRKVRRISGNMCSARLSSKPHRRPF